MARKTDVREHLRRFALGLPEAQEDFPWGEVVVKVNKRIFVFLGLPAPGEAGGFGVKLRESQEQALAIDGAAPTGYGLGRAGWVSIDLGGDIPSLGVLTDFVEESYRIVAPKRLVTQLDARTPGSARR